MPLPLPSAVAIASALSDHVLPSGSVLRSSQGAEAAMDRQEKSATCLTAAMLAACGCFGPTFCRPLNVCCITLPMDIKPVVRLGVLTCSDSLYGVALTAIRARLLRDSTR
jgi:hypothetical protein